METSIDIVGEPATFATARERPWKDAIGAAARAVPTPLHVSGVTLQFRVSALQRNGQPYDLDNLCEPVFSALCREGWFGGKRNTIAWWWATRTLSHRSGVRVIPGTAPSARAGTAGIAGTYRGPLPRNGADAHFARWAHHLAQQHSGLPSGARLGLALHFGLPTLNIADIATGRVKNVIDNLYPILGGRAGAPSDWRIDNLFVDKCVADLPTDVLRVAIWSV